MATDSKLFEQFRNPDGTCNGIKALAKVSGLSEETVREIWEKTKDKRKKELDESNRSTSS
jgi:hypothetical protein